MKKKIFIVDSYFTDHCNENVVDLLNKLGFSEEKGNLYLSGASGAPMILNEDIIGVEKLLIFMSTFHGDLTEPIKLSKEIKELNPGARIYLRSTVSSSDTIFDDFIHKHDEEKFMWTIREFVEED